MHALIHDAGAFLLQAAITFPDTIVTKQVTTEPGAFQKFISYANGVMTIAMIVLAVGLVPAAFNFRKTFLRVNELLDRVYGDITPMVRSLSVVTEDVREIVASVKGDARMVQQTVAATNDRLLKAVKQAEERIDHFNALMAVVQGEAESAFVNTAATVRGVRTGLGQVFEHNDGDDDGSDDYNPTAGTVTPRPRLKPRRGLGGLA